MQTNNNSENKWIQWISEVPLDIPFLYNVIGKLNMYKLFGFEYV